MVVLAAVPSTIRATFSPCCRRRRWTPTSFAI